ncbi:MAG: NnrU family protein [Pseudomonadota bacterium]
MPLLLTGLVVFFGIHAVPMFPDFRQGLVDKIGRGAWMALFSILSLVGLVLIGQGYRAHWADGNLLLWQPPTWASHISLLLMLFASIAIVAAYVPSRIRDILKHPMLVAIKIWAVAHLLANGDLASVILFSAFLIWAIADRISVKRRAALGPLGEKTGTLTGDIIVLGAGIALYLAFMLWVHEWLIGVAPVTVGG